MMPQPPNALHPLLTAAPAVRFPRAGGAPGTSHGSALGLHISQAVFLRAAILFYANE